MYSRERTRYAKLVRNKIPDIIRRDGLIPVVRTLKDSERKRFLLRKLREEAKELEQAETPEEIESELADLSEVVQALIYEAGSTPARVEVARVKKAQTRGDFSDFIFLIETHPPEECS